MKGSRRVDGFVIISILLFLTTIGLVISAILGFVDVISFYSSVYVPVALLVVGFTTSVMGSVFMWLGIVFYETD